MGSELAAAATAACLPPTPFSSLPLLLPVGLKRRMVLTWKEGKKEVCVCLCGLCVYVCVCGGTEGSAALASPGFQQGESLNVKEELG